ASTLIEVDPDYRKAAASVLDAPKSDPPYERIESSLMVAFEAIPRLERPTKAESRIFQLRIYESHNSLAGKKKVEMFNTGGEIAIFRKTGLNPVFFGESLIGPKLPNLTYMLGFDDAETKEKGWDTFRVDPEWKKLKENPYYKDTVSNITNILLRPASCSQI
ncbi:MAG: NIPSNAP family protein, partial [Planctomycetota bacterium]